MTNYADVVYWLTLINQSDLKLNLIKPIIQRWCVDEQRPLADLFNLPPLDISTTFGLSDAQAQQILATPNKLAEQASSLTQWQNQGYHPLIQTDPRYPQRLAYTLPPAQQPLVLWTRGPVALLNKPGVTMLGQHASNEATTHFIDELMATLEKEEIGLISGYSRGMDRTTFETMLATAAGFGVAVLPMGLSAFTQTTDKLEPAIQAGQALLVSPFAPDTPYNDKFAEARNLLIDHMTLALLIPESDEEAQSRATAALTRGLPVFVKADTTENRALIDLGALLLTDSGEVVDWVQQALVDAALIEESEEELEPEELAAAPLNVTAPTDPPQSDDDYSLHTEEVPPLDSEEALEVLSLGGAVPEILRQRLEDKTGTDSEDD